MSNDRFLQISDRGHCGCSAFQLCPKFLQNGVYICKFCISEQTFFWTERRLSKGQNFGGGQLAITLVFLFFPPCLCHDVTAAATAATFAATSSTTITATNNTTIACIFLYVQMTEKKLPRILWVCIANHKPIKTCSPLLPLWLLLYRSLPLPVLLRPLLQSHLTSLWVL